MASGTDQFIVSQKKGESKNKSESENETNTAAAGEAPGVSSRNSPPVAQALDVNGDVNMDDNSTTTSSAAPETRIRRSTRTKPSGDQLDDLRALPELRPIPWKAGKELPLEQSIEAQRVQTRGACLLVTRGEVRDPPCSHCSKDVGRFSLCVASDDWFNGACATCQLATRANQCDFRKPDTLRVKPDGQSMKQDSNDALNSTPKIDTTTTKDSEGNEPQPEPSQLPARQEPLNLLLQVDTSGRKKRKRKSAVQKPGAPKGESQPAVEWKAYTSPYLPSQPTNGTTSSPNSFQAISPFPSTPTYSSPYVLPPPNSRAPNTTTSQDPKPPVYTPPSYINNVYQKDDTHGHYRHYQPIAQAPRAPLPAYNTPRDGRPQQLQPQPQSPYGPAKHFTAVKIGRDTTESLSPSTQLLQPTYSPPDPQIPVNVIVPKPTAHALAPRPTSQPKHANMGNSAADPTLIDVLPRKKQKQIYSIIGGLQSGIRSCQQQAENMQRQLNALQAALGIEADDGVGLDGV